MHVLSVLPSCVRYALVAAIGCTLSISAAAQLSGAPTPIGRSTSSSGNTMSNSTMSATTTESIPAPTVAAPNTSPFAGSVASGKPTDEVLRLSIRDALDRGLRYNLGVVLSGTGTQSARAQRLRALSDLLPHINARSSETVEQINLAAFGFPPPAGTTGIIGPFSVFDVRGTASQTIFDLHAIDRTRSASAEVRASDLAQQDAREITVLVVANLYLQALAGQARVESAHAQFTTADTIYRQSLDLKKNGVAAGIDVLRAQVTAQVRQLRVVSTENDLAKAKLALARAIGLPLGQKFELADAMPNAPIPPVTLEKVFADAYQNRPDYLRATARVRAAELERSAATAQRFPLLRFDGDYGTLGRTPGNSHGTFTAQASLQIPIFEGGRIAADEQQAASLLAQRRAELEDLRGRIDTEIRSAFLDLNAATQRVEVARGTVALAGQQLQQARDRYAAGVSGSLEVTQSEEAVAAANDDLIESTYAANIAKAMLARAAGVAEKSIKEFLSGPGGP
jgi:outer membrane protein TolC